MPVLVGFTMAKRSQRGAELEARVGASGLPVFVLDPQRRVRVFNAGCELLTGFAADEVLGQVCPYASGVETHSASSLAASLCPPPEVFAGQEASVATYLPVKHGPAVARLVQFLPLTDERGKLSGVLGIARPLQTPPPAMPSSPARELHAELAAIRLRQRALFGPQSLIGACVDMRRVLAQVELARQTHSPVLLQGETGTGKEHVARAIHLGSPSRSQWFVPLDCRRLAAEELDRVLDRLFEGLQQASGNPGFPVPGTLYLADVECLPRDVQERIVRAWMMSSKGDAVDANPRSAADSASFVEDRDSLSSRPRIRLLAGTTRSVADAVATEQLLPELAALISVLVIELPPLRRREDDLRLLGQHFLEEQNRQKDKQLSGLSDETWQLFAKYHWPGNVDELAQVIEGAHEHASTLWIQPADLPFRFRTGLDAQTLAPPSSGPSLLLDPLLQQVETRLLQLALARSQSNLTKAAELLGINRARLYRRLEQLGLAPPTGPTSPPEPAPPTDPPA